MAHDVIHISEKEAASDFASVLASVRAGAEVVIESESGKLPVAVIHLPVPPPLDLRVHSSVTRGLYSGHGCRLRQGCRSGYRDSPRTVRTTRMGLILDSSVLITAERQG